MRRYSSYLITGALALIGLVALPALEAAAETIVVYGASGRVGGVIVAEALARGHDVVSISRNPTGLTNDHANFSAVAGDVTSLESVLEAIEGTDVVILSLRGIRPGNTPEEAPTAVAAVTFIQAAGRLGDAAVTFIQAAGRLGDAAPHVIQVGGGISFAVIDEMETGQSMGKRVALGPPE